MTPEENVVLTRVGPGTAMGALMRRYWLPLCESAELGPPDGAPRRVRLLGRGSRRLPSLRREAGPPGGSVSPPPRVALSVAYPCRERNGIVWARLSAGEGAAGELPGLGWAEAAPDRRSVVTYERACNWLQALEGDVDTAHLAFLHARFGPGGEREVAFHAGDRRREGVVSDPRPVLEVAESEVGVTIAARREHATGLTTGVSRIF